MKKATFGRTVMLGVSLLAVLAMTFPVAGNATTGLPGATTGYTSNVTYSSVVLYGYSDPHGQQTNFVFQYGTTTSYGAQTPLGPVGSGIAGIKVSQSISGLQPDTTYHYRIVTSNASGTTSGGDRTFTTRKLPLSLQIVGLPNPVVFSSPFVVEGTLSGTGNANREIVLQANPFPYTGGFKTVGNPEVASATGGFSFPSVGLSENTQLRVLTVGKPVVVSPVLTENVAVSVTFHVRRTRRHGVVRFYGTVAPAEAGALVGFQFMKPGHKSINEGGSVVKAGTATLSQFSGRIHLRHRGVYRALVEVRDGAHVSNYSEPILVG